MDKPSEWTHWNPVRIHFGRDLLDQVSSFVAPGKVFVICSAGAERRGWVQRLERQFNAGRIHVFTEVPANPNFESITRCRDSASEFGPTSIIGIGGGSVMDTAKVVAHLFPSGLDVAGLLNTRPEQPLQRIPFHLIPTTAGTGSEVTPFATIWNEVRKSKHSFTRPSVYPDSAIVDPSTMNDLPWEITLASAMDAFSQCLESIWNRNRSPITLETATQGILKILEHLPRLMNDLDNSKAREELAIASLFSGLCISQTRTSLAHSISYPLTAKFGIPHGIACSFTLPTLWEFNVSSDSTTMNAVAQRLGWALDQGASENILSFMQKCGFSREWKRYPVTTEAAVSLAAEMFVPGRSDNNIRPAKTDDIAMIVRESFELLS